MPQFAVEVHPAARAELQAAYTWYFERNPAAAVRFLAEVDHAVSAILENPAMWPPYIQGTRRYVLHRFPFSVVYRNIGSRIDIIAFAHGRRRPGYWRSR